MPPWAESAIFRQWMGDALRRRLDFTAQWDDQTAGAFMIALFNGTAQPDRTVPVAQTCYGQGVWSAANEVIDTGGVNWPARGRPLTGVTYTDNAGTDITFFADDLTTAPDVVTFDDLWGNLMYYPAKAPTNNSPADQGVAFHYYGGAPGPPHAVAAGSFTIIWNPGGVLLVTV